MFTGCGDGIARAYSARSSTLLKVFVGHIRAINCMVSTDRKLFTGSIDGTFRVWDAEELYYNVVQEEA